MSKFEVRCTFNDKFNAERFLLNLPDASYARLSAALASVGHEDADAKFPVIKKFTREDGTVAHSVKVRFPGLAARDLPVMKKHYLLSLVLFEYSYQGNTGISLIANKKPVEIEVDDSNSMMSMLGDTLSLAALPSM